MLSSDGDPAPLISMYLRWARGLTPSHSISLGHIDPAKRFHRHLHQSSRRIPCRNRVGSNIRLLPHGSRVTNLKTHHSKCHNPPSHLSLKLFFSLEVPILLQPDTDFQSMDATRISPDSWLEMPLKSERRMPVRCAVSLSCPPRMFSYI